VLAFDYHRFRNTTGNPTEEAFTTDTLKVIQWAILVANIPGYHIVLIAQSLGTALACPAASHLIDEEPKVKLAGIFSALLSSTWS
jgi:hypothetical protein